MFQTTKQIMVQLPEKWVELRKKRMSRFTQTQGFKCQKSGQKSMRTIAKIDDK